MKPLFTCFCCVYIVISVSMPSYILRVGEYTLKTGAARAREDECEKFVRLDIYAALLSNARPSSFPGPSSMAASAALRSTGIASLFLALLIWYLLNGMGDRHYEGCDSGFL